MTSEQRGNQSVLTELRVLQQQGRKLRSSPHQAVGDSTQKLFPRLGFQSSRCFLELRARVFLALVAGMRVASLSSVVVREIELKSTHEGGRSI